MLEGTVITTGNLGDIEEIDADLLDVQGYVLLIALAPNPQAPFTCQLPTLTPRQNQVISSSNQVIFNLNWFFF